MPRRKRTWLPGVFYHIVSRGNRRGLIFLYRDDFLKFCQILSDVSQKTPFELAAFCLMDNHYHLLLSSHDVHISKIMARINKRYADYFNKRYDLCGHVFEKRFFDEPIIGRKSLLEVSRYIHMNPVEAGMAKQPEDYLWSSYRLYKNLTENTFPYVNTKPILDLYEGSLEEKSKHYCNFVVYGWGK